MAKPKRVERLTKRIVDALPKAERRYRVTDEGQRALKLVVEPSGRKWWTVRYVTPEGRESETHIGDWPGLLVEAARHEAAQIRQQATRVDPAAERRRTRDAARKARVETFGKLADHYLAASERGEFGGRDGRPKAQSTIDKERVYLGRIDRERPDTSRPVAKVLDKRPSRSITRTELVSLLEDVRAKSGPAAANSSLEAIRRVLAYGVHKGLLEANHTRDIPSFPRPPRDVIATDAQLKALWQALEEAKRERSQGERKGDSYASAAVLQLCLLTLQRRGEVAAIHRDQVDFDKAVWTIPALHKKERRIGLVPLAPNALALLREAFDRSSGVWAFEGPTLGEPITPRAVSRFMARLRESADALGELTPHDLRRTGRTRLTSDELGVDQVTAERVLNHVTGTRQQRAYDWQAYMTQKRAALEAWEREVDRIVHSEPPSSPAQPFSNVIPMRRPR